MIYASVCSGVEAASLAWMPLGWKAAWFSEIEPFPCEVLKQRFPDVPNLEDMTKIKGEEYRGKIDLLVGGTPCQDLSIAGNRAGFGGKRSSLALDFVRLAYESGCKWIVWENVPGVFSSRGGGDFAAFLSLLSGSKVEIPGGGFATSGFVCNARRDRYGLAWRVLDAQFTRVPGFSFAVPQRRRRVFVVGYFGDWTRAAEVLLEPGRMQWDSPPRRTKGAGVARCITGSTGGASGKEQQHTFISGEGMPLNALGIDGYNGAVTGNVTATVDTNSKNVNGPTLVMATGQANAEVTVQHSPALNCNHEQPIVCAGFSGGQGAKAGGIGYEDEVAPTIRSSESGSNQVPDVVCYENHAQDSRIPENGGNGNGFSEELAYTQNATGVMGVPVNTSVRRLLPVECERLMGFPEVNVLEIGKMTKDEFIAWEIASGNIIVDADNGIVYSTRTGGGTPCEPHKLEGTLLHGYRVVSLREKQIKKQCKVHRVIWIAKHGVIPDGYVVDHINNNKLDNRIANLQLITSKENSTKAARDGLYLCGNASPVSKISESERNEIITLYETGLYSLRKLSAVYGVSKSRVQQLVKRVGWTQIPWKGKPEEECPDSHRYKACGNSMCVNVMRWIGMRIEQVERKMK